MSNKIGQPNPRDIAQTSNISYQIRQAIRDALPSPAEQFLTMMIPGKVVNFEVNNEIGIWNLLLTRI